MAYGRTISMTNCKGDEAVYLVQNVHNPLTRRTEAMAVYWKTPPPGQFKLNSDASVVGDQATKGGVLCDHTGKVILAFSKNFGSKSVLEAEALTLCFGLQLSLHSGFMGVVTKVDSQVLQQLVTSSSSSRWPLCNTVQIIKCQLIQLAGSILYVFREANMVANAVAALDYLDQFQFQTMQQLPQHIRALERLDSFHFP